MGEILRLGVIGCGAVAVSHHLPAIKKCKQIQLVAVVDQDGNRAENVAKQHGVSYFSENYRDAVEKVEAVLISVPNHMHRELSCFFLERGVHVLCEKPFAVSSAEAREMLECARKSRRRIIAAQNQRFQPGIQFIKKALDEGLLGDDFVMAMSLGDDISKYRARTDFRTDSKAVGSGVLYDSGIHLVDLAIWMLDDTNLKVSSALLCRDEATNVICDADIVLKSGRKSAILACSFTHFLEDYVRVEGPESNASSRLWGSDVSFHSRDSFLCRKYGVVNPVFPKVDSYTLQLRHFSDAILYERPFIVKEEEIVAGIKLIEECCKLENGQES